MEIIFDVVLSLTMLIYADYLFDIAFQVMLQGLVDRGYKL